METLAAGRQALDGAEGRIWPTALGQCKSWRVILNVADAQAGVGGSRSKKYSLRGSCNSPAHSLLPDCRVATSRRRCCWHSRCYVWVPVIVGLYCQQLLPDAAVAVASSRRGWEGLGAAPEAIAGWTTLKLSSVVCVTTHVARSRCCKRCHSSGS